MNQQMKNMGDLVSIVVPVYNEASVISSFHERLIKVLSGISEKSEIIYINDGSTDESSDILFHLTDKDPQVAYLDLSRNFGKEVAMTAGIDHSLGEAVIIIDADLQDPPELIPELIKKWHEGYDVVNARRISRSGETWLKKLTAHLFYRLIKRMANVNIPEDTGDYRLLNRKAVNALCSLRERNRFMKGLFAWIGFKCTSVEYHRNMRHAGVSKWGYWRLWNLAIEGFTSFTTAPLKLATYLGVVTAFSSFLYGVYFIARTLLLGNPVPGYPSLIVIVLFIGGIQLMSIGVIGEYLGRIFDETKQRPLYLVKDYTPSVYGQVETKKEEVK